MDEQTARWILNAVTAVGVAVWFAALWFVNSAYRSRQAVRQSARERFEPAGPPPENHVFSSVELEGGPSRLLAKATSMLIQENAAPLGQLKIVERTDTRIRFEGTDTRSSTGGSGQGIRRGQILLSPLPGGRTSVDYAVEVPSGRGLLLAAVACLILGIVALVSGFVAINTWVVSSANPSVRGQTFQIFQVSHFLWPPFLFGSLYRRQHAAVQARLDTLIHNLPYYGG